MMTVIAWILIGFLALLLLTAAVFDLRSRTIPNGLNLAIALLAIPYWWSTGLSFWPDVALQLGLAALIFGGFSILFALGAMGGGDVKMAAALVLWLPPGAILPLLIVMSLAGGALTIAMMIRQLLARMEGNIEVPYGVAIAFGGFWVLSEQFLNHFS